MPKTAAYDLKIATAVLEDVAQELRQQKWFAINKWCCSVHNFPPPPAAPESVTLHLNKEHWYNEDHQGIHFETFLSDREWRTGVMPVMLHILHTPLIPGTRLKRIKLSQPFVDACYDLVSGWPGYKFRAGKYGTQPFSCTVAFDIDKKAELKSDLVTQLKLMAEKLGPLMDEKLREVLA